MLCPEVESYAKYALGLPFLYFSDLDFKDIQAELHEHGFSVLHLSDFCPGEDRFPSIDDLIDTFRTTDVDYKTNKILVVGLGEYFALRGKDFATKELRRLKNITTGSARVVLLIAGMQRIGLEAIGDDHRLQEQRRVFFSDSSNDNRRITLVKSSVSKFVKEPGFKALLRALEDGNGNCVMGSSDLLLENSLIPITYLNDSFDVLKNMVSEFPFERSYGSDDEWGFLLEEVQKHGSITSVFEKNGLPLDFDVDIYERISMPYRSSWLYFLFLKLNEEKIINKYLRITVHIANSLEDLKEKILDYIISVSPSDPSFNDLYADRKRLVQCFPEGEIAGFIQKNSINPIDSVYRLTDNTLIERVSILKWIKSNGLPLSLERLYAGLKAYLEPYAFKGTSLDDELTTYFSLYKDAKLTSRIPDELAAKVEEYASNYIYTHLQARDAIVGTIPDKDNAFLYWIDALGVEYLSYITYLAKKKGLSINIDIGRAELPTITGINRKFYDAWPSQKKKEDRLDELKHNPVTSAYLEDDGSAAHLAYELEVISEAIDYAQMLLASHQCRSFIIASDHGASRPAVLNIQENKYETDTGGEHSGRCCKEFPGCDLPCCVNENGYITLTDYGRFKGSRAAVVEVHGGGTLEEVVVPIITLTLKRQAFVEIQLMYPDQIYADRHSGTEIVLYVSDVTNKKKLSLMIDNKSYFAVQWLSNPQHYKFHLGDIRHAKKCRATVFDGDDLIGSVELNIKSKTGSVKSDFDDWF